MSTPCHGTNLRPPFLETGIFGLDPLTDIESTANSRCSSPDSNDFPEPLRKRTRLADDREQIEGFKREADTFFQGFQTAKSSDWHLDDARRAVTAFRGRPDMLCKNRLVVPKETPPNEHLSLLKRHGYKLIKIR